MIEYINIEIPRIWKTKKFIPALIIMTLFFIVSFFVSYYAPTTSNNLLIYYYYVFAVNAKMIFPIAIIVFFGPILINEYRDKTIKLLWGSKFDKTTIYLGKFLSGVIYFITIFIILLTVYLIVSSIFFTNLTSIYTKSGLISKSDIAYRSIVILFSEFSYLLCFASLVFLISIITRNQLLSFLISISIIVLYTFIPLPSWLVDYIFLNGSGLHTALILEDFPYIDLLKKSIVNITTISILILAGILIIRKQEI